MASWRAMAVGSSAAVLLLVAVGVGVGLRGRDPAPPPAMGSMMREVRQLVGELHDLHLDLKGDTRESLRVARAAAMAAATASSRDVAENASLAAPLPPCPDCPMCNVTLTVSEPGDRSPDGRRLAYALYLTRWSNDNYACAVVVMAKQLRKLSRRPGVDFIILHTDGVPEVHLERVKALGFKAVRVDDVCCAIPGRWQHSYAKTRLFQMTQYDRLVYVDADAYLFKSLDHLFDIPECIMAAPKAYWLPQPWFTSLLLVVTPSESSWERLQKWFGPNVHTRVADMDVLNKEFGKEAYWLAGEYGLLDTEFNPKDTPARGSFGMDFYATFNERVYLVHFSTFGLKPWERSLEQLTNDFPPILREVYLRWYNDREYFCRRDESGEPKISERVSKWRLW